MSCCLYDRFQIVKQKIFNKFSKYYTLFLFEHKYVFIFCYLLMLIAASFGLLQLKADESNQHLVYVTNSQALANRHHLERLFDKRDYYFQHQLFDTGYYVEFIVTLNERNGRRRMLSYDDLMLDEFNLINETYLSEFNYLYDQIVNLSIDEAPNKSSNQSTPPRIFTYLNDLCPRRNQICAIEGSVLRTASFQSKLLAHQVDYERDDPKEVHMDTDSNDGSSLMFLFGNKYRKEKCESNIQEEENAESETKEGEEGAVNEAKEGEENNDVNEDEKDEDEADVKSRKKRGAFLQTTMSDANCTKKNFIVHTAVFRVRFDLNVTNDTSKRRALKFMDTFVSLMQNLTGQIDRESPSIPVNNLNVSFYASHTLEKEIAKYSGFEVHFVLYFWFAYLIMFTTFISLNLKLTHLLNAIGAVVCCLTSKLKSLLGCWNNSKKMKKVEENKKKKSMSESIKQMAESLSDVAKKTLIFGGFYMILAAFIQFVLTLAASFGFMSFLGINSNELLFTIAFLLLVNMSSQTALLHHNLIINYKSFYLTIKKRKLLKRIETERLLCNAASANRKSFVRAHQVQRDQLNESIYSPKLLTKEELKKCFKLTMLESFTPNVFIMITIVLIYAIIAFTSCFRAIQIYCYFTVICFIFNYLGQLMFFCPILLLNLMRMNNNKNCFLFCFRHREPISRVEVKLLSKTLLNSRHLTSTTLNVEQEKEPKQIIKSTDDNQNQIVPNGMKEEEEEKRESSDESSSDDDEEDDVDITVETRQVIQIDLNKPNDENKEEETSIEVGRFKITPVEIRTDLAKSSVSFKMIDDDKTREKKRRNEIQPKSSSPSSSSSIQCASKLFKSNYLRYVILLLFVAYITFNSLVIAKRTKTNIPLFDLIPADSYLHKHMKNHHNLYKMGPMVVVNFIKPMSYWNKSVSDQIDAFMSDGASLPGMMAHFRMSWLDQMRANFDLFKSCDNLYEHKCFSTTFRNAMTNDMIFGQDYAFRFDENDKIEIDASRVYLQMGKFDGTLDEYELIDSLRSLAAEKYNWTSDKLIIYTIVDVYLEQLSELTTTLVSILLISIEVIYFTSLTMVMDFKATLALTLVVVSFALSVISTLTLLGVTLNIISIMNYLMMPAFIVELTFHMGFLYSSKKVTQRIEKQKNQQQQQQLQQQQQQHQSELEVEEVRNVESSSSSIASYVTAVVQEDDETKKNSVSTLDNLSAFSIPSSMLSDEATSSVETKEKTKYNKCKRKLHPSRNESRMRRRLKNLNYSFTKTTIVANRYLILLILSMLYFMSSCATYTFRSLYFYLLFTSLNALLHLYIFFPTFLVLFDLFKF